MKKSLSLASAVALSIALPASMNVYADSRANG